MSKLLNIFRPSLIAITILSRLSSVIIRSEACLAVSVPFLPMATPMSDARRAGASLIPSPVIATISPFDLSALITFSFASGNIRVKIEKFWTVFFNSSSLILMT